MFLYFSLTFAPTSVRFVSYLTPIGVVVDDIRSGSCGEANTVLFNIAAMSGYNFKLKIKKIILKLI